MQQNTFFIWRFAFLTSMRVTFTVSVADAVAIVSPPFLLLPHLVGCCLIVVVVAITVAITIGAVAVDFVVTIFSSLSFMTSAVAVSAAALPPLSPPPRCCRCRCYCRGGMATL
jgi:hypothetical protein